MARTTVPFAAADNALGGYALYTPSQDPGSGSLALMTTSILAMDVYFNRASLGIAPPTSSAAASQPALNTSKDVATASGSAVTGGVGSTTGSIAPQQPSTAAGNTPVPTAASSKSSLLQVTPAVGGSESSPSLAPGPGPAVQMTSQPTPPAKIG